MAYRKSFKDPQWAYMYLQMKGIKKTEIDMIKHSLAEDAIQNAKLLEFDRVYMCALLALKRGFDFDDDQMKTFLKEFDKTFDEIIDSDMQWPEITKMIADETGYIVRHGDVCDYKSDEEQDYDG